MAQGWKPGPCLCYAGAAPLTTPPPLKCALDTFYVEDFLNNQKPKGIQRFPKEMSRN